MLKCKRQNIHYSKLPPLGAIGYLIKKYNRFGEPEYFFGEKQKYQVIAYPLCDSVQPYSMGIHTTYFQNLKTRRIEKMSGFYFEEAMI